MGRKAAFFLAPKRKAHSYVTGLVRTVQTEGKDAVKKEAVALFVQNLFYKKEHDKKMIDSNAWNLIPHQGNKQKF